MQGDLPSLVPVAEEGEDNPSPQPIRVFPPPKTHLSSSSSTTATLRCARWYRGSITTLSNVCGGDCGGDCGGYVVVVVVVVVAAAVVVAVIV